MVYLPDLPADYYQCMASIAFALIIGKFLHAEMRVSLAALTGAILTGSYSGVIGAVIICFMFKAADFIRWGD